MVIAIDNSDTGHAAMGAEAAHRYIESQPEDQRASAWKRIMVGYTLAEGLPTTPDLTNLALDNKMSEMMHKKSLNSHSLHASSKVKINGCQRLADWLHPDNFTMGKTNHTFLREFGNAYPWIVKGDPQRSLFIKEILFGGRMFGALTGNECKMVESWVEKLSSHQVHPVDSSIYYNFVQAPVAERIVPEYRPVSSLCAISSAPSTPRQAVSKPELERFLAVRSKPSLPFDFSLATKEQQKRLLALHFVSLALLEEATTLPARCSNAIGMHIVQALRALHGFERTPEEESEGVSGMDQVNDAQPSLFDLGTALCQARCIEAPTSLSQVANWPLQGDDQEFLAILLRLSSHHVRQQPLLLGLALGAARSLHTSSFVSALSIAQQQCMSGLSTREVRALEAAIQLLAPEGRQLAHKGRMIIESRVGAILDV